jgi:hypothetical protein
MQAAKAKETIETLRAQSKKAEAANSKAMSDLKDKVDELKLENDELKVRASVSVVGDGDANPDNNASVAQALECAHQELETVQRALAGAVAKVGMLEVEKVQVQGDLEKLKVSYDEFKEKARQAMLKSKERERKLNDMLAVSKSAANLPASEQTNGLSATPARRGAGAGGEPLESLRLQMPHKGPHDGAGNEDDGSSSAGGGTNSNSNSISNAKSPSGADDDVTSVVSVSDSAHTPTSLCGDAADHKFAAEKYREHASAQPPESLHVPSDAHSHSDGTNAHEGSARSISSDVGDVSAAEYRERALRLLEDKDRHIAELKAKLKAAEKDKGSARPALVRPSLLVSGRVCMCTRERERESLLSRSCMHVSV